MLDERAQAVRQTLRRLTTRSAQALQYFALEGRSTRECAELFGIPAAAFEVMLLRAAFEYAAELPGAGPRGRRREGPRWRTAEEAARARALREALEGQSVPAEPRLLALRDAVRELKELAPALAELEAAAQRRAQQSPRRNQELWLRRLLVVAVLALTALLYARDELGRSPVRPEPRPSPPQGGAGR